MASDDLSYSGVRMELDAQSDAEKIAAPNTVTLAWAAGMGILCSTSVILMLEHSTCRCL